MTFKKFLWDFAVGCTVSAATAAVSYIAKFIWNLAF